MLLLKGSQEAPLALLLYEDGARRQNSSNQEMGPHHTVSAGALILDSQPPEL